ncbi:nucleoside deaminase [Erysipelotrichaceae bacterium RD49]|nr:nucleoside deaminase [Erysipelotrichaceae bacterium RD49]
MQNVNEKYMKSALRLAQKAEVMDEVPVGAVIVHEGRIIGRGYNRRQTKQNSLEHAELMAIAQACRKLGSWRLEGCDLYVTLEPCPMCAGAIIQSRVRKVYFGAFDAKGGAVGSVTNLFELPQWNHHPDFEGGLLEDECSKILKDFFRAKRQKKKLKKKLRQTEANEGEECCSDHGHPSLFSVLADSSETSTNTPQQSISFSNCLETPLDENTQKGGEQ